MNSIHVALAVLLTTVTCLAQGQVVFANKVGTTVDSPVFINGTQYGPGPNYSAQLWLQGLNGSLTPLTPSSTFYERGTSGTQLVADRYWELKLVDVPLQPGTDGTFVVRAWLTSLGNYDNARAAGYGFAQSDPFVVSVGGGTLPPPNLTTLKSFGFSFPEPPTITLGLLGAAAMLMFGRAR